MSTYRSITRYGTHATLLVALSLFAGHDAMHAQSKQAVTPAAGFGDDPPAMAALVAFARTESDLRVAVDRYVLDKAAIERRYELPYSPVRQARMKTFYEGWRRAA